MVNPVAAGFCAGGILAHSQGPRAALGGAVAFAAFSAAIDLFLRRETPECVSFHHLISDVTLTDSYEVMTDTGNHLFAYRWI